MIYQIFIAIIVIIIEFIAVYFIYKFKQIGDIHNVIDRAVKDTAFNPTYFEIYDKSTKTECNRFIIIQPFRWYLWACNNQLFIVNPEGGVKCNPNTSPAIQVFEDHFNETCLTINIDSLLDGYTKNEQPKIVPYEIEKETFTILSAINILVKKWITFDRTIKPTTNIIHLSNSTTSIEARTLTKELVIDKMKNTTLQHSKIHKHLNQHLPLDYNTNRDIGEKQPLLIS